ncbi:MAG: bifunctional riboflavin kinase/FAD synthetase [Candidatus Omnitrophota bacterium]
MKVIYGLGSIKYKKSAVAIGIFDGIHRGHQRLIKSMISHARKLRAKAVVVTFYPHPSHVLRPEASLPYLISIDHRLRILEELGVDVVLVIPFNRRFARIDPSCFIKEILVSQLGVKAVFVGDNFRFGKDRSGDITLFKDLSLKYGYCMRAVKTLKSQGEIISSGRLRRIIPDGKLKEAQSLLGRCVSVLGQVVHGASRGRGLGYPTANVQYQCDVLPPCGVYAVKVIWNKKVFYGMANLGLRPSFKEKNPKVLLEVHIFDFNRNLYGHQILVEFIRKVRDEISFSSKEELIAQIEKDELRIRRLSLKNQS